MELTSLLVAIVSAAISLGSAYAAWRATRPHPKLRGAITAAWLSGRSTRRGAAPQVVERGLAVGLHVLLTNETAHSVHPVGYQLKIRVSGKWHVADRMATWDLQLPDLHVDGWVVNMEPAQLLNWPPRPVHHGEPLMGWLVFGLPTGLSGTVEAYRLTVIDVFERRTIISASQKQIDAHQEGGKYFSVLEAFQHAGASITRGPASSRLNLPNPHGPETAQHTDPTP
ncbi:hypothetical protein OG369_43410 [Streptomyces sp. NBC_01221]|uniref:hypothetical protein n=1 Tax=Streptomyces sp. NBC_01221 TaxID=2903782 RepID=UPI00225045BB|nr:hypothetical protein [Streptomyces sp. NBC_01221]MCX4792627.1 hypothetical protein [Streptomyces sp. NBC_01221]